MKESEFRALIRLLEDDDPQVAAHVEEKLTELGGEAIPRLEQAWEIESDELIQHRLEEIIHDIQEFDTRERLAIWRDEAKPELLAGWFLVTKYLFPNIKFSTYQSRINRIVNRIWLEFRRNMTAAEKLMVVNAMLFRVEKFRPGGRQLRTGHEFLINLLFDKRRGGPFSLGLLYKVICDKLEIPLEVVILPNYLLLRYADDKTEFFIDVFQKGDFFVREDVAKFLKELKMRANTPEISKTVDPFKLIEELINGLEKVYKNKKDDSKMAAVKQLKELLERE